MKFPGLSELKSMKFENMTQTISIGVLGLWAVYILLIRGVIGILISASIGLLIASFEKRIEIIAAGTVILSFIIIQAIKTFRIMEFYTNGGTGPEIAKRLAAIDKLGPVNAQMSDQSQAAPANTTYPLQTGYVSVEGFEDAAAPVSKPAPAKTKNPVNQIPKDLQDQVKQALTAAGLGSETADNTNTKDKKTGTEPKPIVQPFQSESSGLFKLGEIPTESRDGPMIDAGSTFMKAISALDPSQIKSMSEDTAKMVDAQKNLIGLLNTMKPIIQDGSKLLTTFSGILGKQDDKMGQLVLGKMN